MWKWNNNIYKHILSPTIILSCLCPPHSSIPFLIRTLNSFWGLPTLYTDLEGTLNQVACLLSMKNRRFHGEYFYNIFSHLPDTKWSTFKYILHSNVKKRMKIIFSSNNALTTYFLLWHDFSLPFLTLIFYNTQMLFLILIIAFRVFNNLIIKSILLR